MLTHSMFIYAWPISLVRDLEHAVKRFIWSREKTKNKVVTVTWKNICNPLEKGVLGLRSIIGINEASNLKLA